MKTLRIAFWAVVAVCLILIGLANREMVTLHALPASLGRALGISPDISLPLFVVIFIGVGIGLMLGFLWEWLRSGRFRAEARGTAREAKALRAELDKLRDADGDGRDDVLQILEDAEGKRPK